jgi:hypothetical protein
MLSTWVFSLYIDYDFSSDYFLPTNYHNTETLEIILRDMCKYDPNITNVDQKINKIITNLKKVYSNQLELLKEYMNSTIYCNNKNNYSIKKTLVTLKKNKSVDKPKFYQSVPIENNTSEDNVFYKFDIKVKFVIKDKRLVNILNNILVPKKIYEKLASIYIGNMSDIDTYIWAILFRYQLLGSNNHQLAVLPSIMNQMKTDYENESISNYINQIDLSSLSKKPELTKCL